MKFTAGTKTVRDALARLSAIPGAKGGPSAAIVKIETTMDGVEITRRTPESRITVSFAAEILEEGDLIADYGRAVTVLSRIDDDKASFETSKDKKWLNMESDGTQGRIAILPETAEWNFGPDEEVTGEKCAIPAAVLRRAIQTVEPAICNETARANMMGLQVTELDGRGALVATNGRICHIAYLPSIIEGGGIIPPDAIPAILNATKEEQGDIAVQMSEMRLLIVSASMTFGVQLMESNFPDAPGLFVRCAKSTAIQIEVNKSQLASAVKAASATGVGELAVIEVKQTKTAMEIVGDNQEARLRRSISSKCDQKCEFSASASYFLPVIDSIPGENITINYHPEICAISCIHEDVKSFFALINPPKK